MAYTVNTKVNLHRSPQKNNSNMLTVFTLVDSKSNLATSGLQYIRDTADFEHYFPDPYTDYTKTLRQAQKVLDYGYNLLTYNVRSCQHKETVRIFHNGDSYKGVGYGDEFEFHSLQTSLHGTTHLAIKFKLEDLTDGNYLLLEHNLNNKPCNCYVGTFEDNSPIIKSINYSSRSYHMFVYNSENGIENEAKRLLNILTKTEDYVGEFTSDGYIHLMYAYPFENEVDVDASALQSNRVPIEYDNVYLQNYLNNIDYKNRVLEVESKYNSDIADLAIEFRKSVNGRYEISVYKYKNGSTIEDTENYYNSDVERLFDQVNSLSEYVTIKWTTTEFPLGKFNLVQIHDPETVTADTYIDAVYALEEMVNEEYCFNVNIILEPDGGFELADQKRLQQSINYVFRNISNMYVKFFNYLGTLDTNLSCYFDNSSYQYDGIVYNTKMLVLKFLNTKSKNIALNNIAVLKNDVQESYPYAVNSAHIGFTYLTFDRIKCLLRSFYYDVYDMLVVSCVNTAVNSTTSNKTELYFYSLTESLSSYFLLHFGYDPKVTVSEYKNVNDGQVQVKIEYQTSDMSEVTSIDLLLDLYDTAN